LILRVFENPKGEHLLTLNEQMLSELGQLREEILVQWNKIVVIDIQKGLNHTLLWKDKINLHVNFTQELKNALKDIKVLTQLNVDMTQFLLDFFAKEEFLWVRL